MPDIIVTSPKKLMAQAEQEALDCIANGGGEYFRSFGVGTYPKIELGERVWYCENGFIRGFCPVTRIKYHKQLMCDTTGRYFGPGIALFMDATGWKWTEPIIMRGFQGWRYFNGAGMCIIGGWLDPKPNPERCAALLPYLNE